MLNNIIIFIIALFAVTSPCFSQGVPQLSKNPTFVEFDKSSGFKDLKFGMNLKYIINLVGKNIDVDLVNNFFGQKFYTITIKDEHYRRFNNIKFGTARLTFTENDNRFYKIVFRDAEIGYEQAYNNLVKLFGLPQVRERVPQTEVSFYSSWEGKNTHIDLQGGPKRSPILTIYNKYSYNEEGYNAIYGKQEAPKDY